ncbi:hypothetical protein LHGZ1_1586 [Laribacter hongkongensis]|uniref:Uncharacterized protein n=1 Tax=Laribacter hongkongensis TaxID=168471 RepID=A0A248LI36_9NEIS|nr:hypothetical protein LHGZ1_1586 [Laribacter hongkongensis]
MLVAQGGCKHYCRRHVTCSGSSRRLIWHGAYPCTDTVAESRAMQ